MIILGGLLIFVGLCWLGSWLLDGDGLLVFGLIISLFFLVVAVPMIPINRLITRGEIAEFKSIAQTVEQARVNGVLIENAALQHKIIDANRWLAQQQYFNGTLIDIWIPDEVDELKPIE